ncbi:hypothetical protein [Nonomuraea sp. SYSU D8015]|uniref:hypothetical protein n=1 Tax=Nonomuraea sp. SYSU D8015 TaxID=2593644 RepID=UPI001660795D|nr:hypothetical protein [Nonomuraea sp. SYSU D8015]
MAALVWMVLVLRAQRHDDRWQRATVMYGIAALAVPFLLPLAGLLLVSVGNVPADAIPAAETLMVIWLAGSAHELADPRHQSTPLPTRPPAS